MNVHSINFSGFGSFGNLTAPARAAAKPVTKNVPARPSVETRICKGCTKPFTPARYYYRICQSCFDAASEKSAQPVPATAPKPALQLPSEKDVMRAWAKACYEANNLPDGANIVRGAGDKVTLTLGNRVVIFSSLKPLAVTAKNVAIAETGKKEPAAIPEKNNALQIQRDAEKAERVRQQQKLEAEAKTKRLERAAEQQKRRNDANYGQMVKAVQPPKPEKNKGKGKGNGRRNESAKAA